MNIAKVANLFIVSKNFAYKYSLRYKNSIYSMSVQYKNEPIIQCVSDLPEWSQNLLGVYRIRITTKCLQD